jgi:Uma2 family endonuclease
MSVDDYLAWSAAERGRHELVDGVPVAMSPERLRHNMAKGATYTGLRTAVEKAGVPCLVFTDGVGVRTGKRTIREPDASVQFTPVSDFNSVLIDSPVIIVEVASPSSERTDTGRKLGEYFGLLGLVHYLVIYPEAGLVVHHRRGTGVDILTHILRGGSIRLDPPGIDLALDDIVAAGTPDVPEPEEGTA